MSETTEEKEISREHQIWLDMWCNRCQTNWCGHNQEIKRELT